MAKVDETKLPGWDEPPPPLPRGGRPGGRPLLRQFGLIHIMILVVYCAILSLSVREIFATGDFAAVIATAVLVGLGFCAAGLWCVVKLSRFAIVGWILFVIGYFAITLATTGALALPTLPILIGAIIYLCLRRHSNNQDTLLWVLRVAADRGIPLAPGVQALSEQVNGMYQIWAGSLADQLNRGVPLPDALENIPPLVPRRSALMIRMGWESGNLPMGIEEAVACRETRQPVLHAIGGRLAYLGWVAAIGTGIVGFVLYFVIPKYEAIFKNFGLELPELTILVIRGSHIVVENAWLWWIPVLAAIGYALMILLGSGDMSIPVFDRLFARRHTIVILRSLAVVVSAGRPIAPAFDALAQWYPTAWIRKSLRQAALDASQGVDWTEALLENGLVRRSDVGVLTSAQRAGNLAWALRELADTGERRWAYRLQAWSQVLFVLAMLVLGLLVFLVAVAFFLPLVSLIERMAS